MFGLFARQPVLEEESAQWLFDVYAWALANFGSDVFHRETILVLPSNQHFPGRETSIPGMARLIFEQVKQHAGVAHWPCRLVDPHLFDPKAQTQLVLRGAIRGARGAPLSVEEAPNPLQITYDPHMVGNPEAIIATFAHTLAHIMGSLANEEPPGGGENWAQATEVLAVFSGFGVMMANSAFHVPKSACGACAPPPSERASYLSQYDLTYALALFTTLKGIPARTVSMHLKPSLRGFFKKALKDVANRDDELARLKAIDRPLPALV